MYPYQLDQIVALARKQPDLQIMINYCASPIDRDAAGVARWRRSVTELGAELNIAIKVSNAAAYDSDPTDTSLRAVMRQRIESFGPARTMLASDRPVAGLKKSYDDISAAPWPT